MNIWNGYFIQHTTIPESHLRKPFPINTGEKTYIWCFTAAHIYYRYFTILSLVLYDATHLSFAGSSWSVWHEGQHGYPDTTQTLQKLLAPSPFLCWNLSPSLWHGLWFDLTPSGQNHNTWSVQTVILIYWLLSNLSTHHIAHWLQPITTSCSKFHGILLSSVITHNDLHNNPSWSP